MAYNGLNSVPALRLGLFGLLFGPFSLFVDHLLDELLLLADITLLAALSNRLAQISHFLLYSFVVELRLRLGAGFGL